MSVGTWGVLLKGGTERAVLWKGWKVVDGVLEGVTVIGLQRNGL